MYRCFLLQCFLLLGLCSHAQQPLPQKQMTYLSTAKPNSIFYNDTFYNGSREYRKLFYRTNDPQLIHLYKKHQFDKIVGFALNTTGIISLTAGTIYASSYHPNISRGVGWGMVGAGVVAAITGSYLTTQSVNDLLVASYLFNKRYGNPKAAIGISNGGLSFVLNL